MKLPALPLPHATAPGELLAALGVEAGRGLTRAEAQARLAEWGPNALPETQRRPLWRMFLTQFQSPLIYILLVAAGLAAALGKHGDAVVILIVVFVNALVGAFQIADVIAAAPSTIWRRFGSKTGLTKIEFDSYFTGLETGFAIEVARTWQLAAPVHLATLRRQRGGFHAPQSYRYLDLAEVLSMGGEALLGRRGVAKPCVWRGGTAEAMP